MYSLMRVKYIFVNYFLLLFFKLFNSSPSFYIVGGKKFYFPKAMSEVVARSIVKNNYESAERKIVKSLISQDDVVLEIGAAVGVLAKFYSDLSPKKHILIEANTALMPILRKNVKGINCEVINALGSWESGSQKFYISNSFYSSSSARRHESDEEVVLDKIDLNSVIKKYRCSVVICDVEGFEYDLISRLDLGSVTKIILEVHQVGSNVLESLVKLLEYLRESGFEINLRLCESNVLVFVK